MHVINYLKTLTPERFLDIYEALANDGFGPLDGEVAKALKFRPKAIRKLPMAQRARRARGILELKANAELAYELFGSYLMKTCKQLVTDFLDATGVPHEEGMIQNVTSDLPDGARVAEAVAKLDQRYDPEDVTLYLSMCREQWPGVEEIDAIWRARPGVATT